MDKNGELKAPVSPCCVCGAPSSIIKEGQAVCRRHADTHRPSVSENVQKTGEFLAQSSTPQPL